MTEQTPPEGLYARESAPQGAGGELEGAGRERAAGGQQAGSGLRGLLEHVGIDTRGRDITVDGRVVDPAPAHNAGPTVAECAEADRRWWGGEKTGEGQ